MSTLRFPPIEPTSTHWSLESNTMVYQSSLSGGIKTSDRTGEHWRVRMEFRNLNGQEKATLAAWLTKLNGQANRFTLQNHAYSKNGGVAVSEMVDVAFNATNWGVPSGFEDRGSLSDITNGVRFVGGADDSSVILEAAGSVDGISAPTEGLTYAATLSVGDSRNGKNSADVGRAQLQWRATSWGTILGNSDFSSTATRLVGAMTCVDASAFFLRIHPKSQGVSDSFGYRQDYYDLSAARCFLVDNGVNALTYSEQADHADWTQSDITVSANAVAAPNGDTTADELVETSSTSTHLLQRNETRTNAAQFWTVSVFFKENTQRRIRLYVDDQAGNGGQGYFDANSGTMIVAEDVGSGLYTYGDIIALDDGWYRARLTTYLPATASLRYRCNLCNGASNTTSYTGDGTSGLYVWGMQAQLGCQLGRYKKTEASADTGDSQTGSGIWLKGLDQSSAGQLTEGDFFEIDGHLYQLTADLDGDAEGCGYAEVRPRVYTAPSDEAAVVLHKPHGTFVLARPDVSWSNAIAGFGSFSIEAIQDLTA